MKIRAGCIIDYEVDGFKEKMANKIYNNIQIF